MITKLDSLEKKYDDISKKISNPEIINQRELWQKLVKELSELDEVVKKYREYKRVIENIEEAKIILDDRNADEELKDLAKEDLKINNNKRDKILEQIKILLLPKDPNDKKNVIVEIRGGAGGDEANLFAGDLFRMYSHYAESKKWRTEILNFNESDIGGFKEIVFMISGNGVYSRLKFESGVHRVQRIPETESNGRIHTSTVTVAILPEAEEVDVKINPNDLRIDVFRSSGNGGQSVNTTDSAVRVTHIPTGIVISCQDEKSQLKNKDKALKILRAKLFDLENEKQKKMLSQERKNQVGTGDRSERIRTYNFPQSRVTDHRINLTLYKLENILNGDLDEIIDSLVTFYQAEKLKNA
ncbi:MAG: peptide chain release factor 1 [Firmicutes bacterium]|nr:peptide chain release factor 1 [Bacillota bacterium]